jgi:hypothetical protein
MGAHGHCGGDAAVQNLRKTRSPRSVGPALCSRFSPRRNRARGAHVGPAAAVGPDTG